MAEKMFLQEERPRFLLVCETLVQIVVAAVLALFIARYFFFSQETLSRSMEPTIPSGSVVFINRSSFAASEPARFDVVAFSRDGEQSSDILIRRIIGLPGENLRIFRGQVYINNEPLDISDVASEITSDGIAAEGILLGSDEYFVLGDMPANSEDSRSSTVGVVSRTHMIGKAWIAFENFTDFRLIR